MIERALASLGQPLALTGLLCAVGINTLSAHLFGLLAGLLGILTMIATLMLCIGLEEGS